MSFKRWNIAPLDKEGAAALAEECEMHPFLALMLSIRGIDTMEAAADYLMGGELEDDPFAFADMDAAVERIQRALDNGERIAVYGDYDCDGVTSTALLYSYLVENGADALYYIPEREGEGYGMHPESVQALKEKGVQLIVTVDNGVSAAEEVKLAAELGMDVVVTDHHMPPQELPPAVAVVDPHRADCGSVCKDYAGVGVAFKLVCALDGDTDAVLERYADLVALGTMADVMPLKGENRKLVRLGLRRITEGARPGLKMLAKAAGAWAVSYTHLRSTLSRLLRQKYLNGRWIGLTMGVCPRCFSLYHFVPFAFFLAVIVTSVLALLGHPLLAVLMWAAYGLAAVLMTIRAFAGGEKFCVQGLLLPFVFLLFHLWYGAGTLAGLCRLPFWKARQENRLCPAVDEVRQALRQGERNGEG